MYRDMEGILNDVEATEYVQNMQLLHDRYNPSFRFYQYVVNEDDFCNQ